jgi:3-hydroxybutyrate dehydrogenase
MGKSADRPGSGGRMSEPDVQPIVALDLSGKSALVTGGASGIGLACVRRLHAAGAEVTIVDRDAPAADAIAAEIGGRAIAIDLSDPGALQSLDLVADVLVNNAGFQVVAPVHEFPPDQFVAMQRVMVEAPFRLIRASLPRMYANGWGRIVNISSAHGLVASPYKVGYVSAKHALEGLSKVVALEAGEHAVTSNCINPGYVRTPLVEKQIADQARAHHISEDQVLDQVFLTMTAIKRLATVAEVAELVAFLCSSAAGYINGASLSLDGGWTAR